MIEERIGEVRVHVRTNLPDAAVVRPAAERIVRATLERCAALLEARAPGRIVLIRHLPLRWRLDESMLDETADVEELARAAADAIERILIPATLITPARERDESNNIGVLFDDEAHWRASYLTALARGQPAWFHAALDEAEGASPLAAFAAPERRAIAHATLIRLAQDNLLAEVLAANPASVVAVLAAALSCTVTTSASAARPTNAGGGPVTNEIVEEIAAIASGWPALEPAPQSLALHVHASLLSGTELDSTETAALAVAAQHALSPGRPPRVAIAPREETAAAVEQAETAVEDAETAPPPAVQEDAGQTVATRCAGLFYLLDRIQELDLAESLWKACLREGEVLAAAAAALVGPRLASDSAILLFGGLSRRTPCPKLTMEQLAEVATTTSAALAEALPRRGLGEVPPVDVRLIEHPAGRLLIAAATDSPFAFFAWPANTAEALRSGLAALLRAWPHRGTLTAPAALVTLDASGRLRPVRDEAAALSLFLPKAASIERVALLMMTAGAPAMLVSARAGATTPNTVAAFVGQRLARGGRIRITRERIDVIISTDDIDLDLRRAGIDRDPGWLPWLGRSVHFVFEEPQ